MELVKGIPLPERRNLVNNITDDFLKEIKYPIGEHFSYNIARVRRIGSLLSKNLPNYLTDKKQTIQLWARGSSGAIIGSIICAALIQKGFKAILLIVRKDTEKSHWPNPILRENAFNVIVDDFICTGNTMDKILEYMLKVKVKPDAVCVSGHLRQSVFPPFVYGDLKFTISQTYSPIIV